MDKTEQSEPAAPAVGIPVERMVGRPVPKRCRDCGLTLVPWLRLWCAKCVQQRLKG